MENIRQCGSDGLKDYKASRKNIMKMKLEGQLGVNMYSRIIVPESVHLGDPAGGYVEMLKARKSARGHLMAWHDKQTIQEYLKELVTGSHLKGDKYGTVMSSEAYEDGLEQIVNMSWRAALQKYFDDNMNTPSTLTMCLANPCVRINLQVRLMWCLVGIKKQEYEDTIETKAREKYLELMGALKVSIARYDYAIV